jgi:uncharacterized phiE125 gp8 family phage protein
MIPVMIAGPAVEPVPLAEMRDYLRLDETAEDALVAALVKAARLTVEAAARRILIESRWRLRLDRWPADRVVRLPLSPLVGVDEVRVFPRTGPAVTVDLAAIALDPASDPPRLEIAAHVPPPGWLKRGIEIDVTAGYGPAPETVPEPLRQAVRLLAAHWFERRGDDGPAPLPDLHALVAPFRVARL